MARARAASLAEATASYDEQEHVDAQSAELEPEANPSLVTEREGSFTGRSNASVITRRVMLARASEHDERAATDRSAWSAWSSEILDGEAARSYNRVRRTPALAAVAAAVPPANRDFLLDARSSQWIFHHIRQTSQTRVARSRRRRYGTSSSGSSSVMTPDHPLAPMTRRSDCLFERRQAAACTAVQRSWRLRRAGVLYPRSRKLAFEAVRANLGGSSEGAVSHLIAVFVSGVPPVRIWDLGHDIRVGS